MVGCPGVDGCRTESCRACQAAMSVKRIGLVGLVDCRL